MLFAIKIFFNVILIANTTNARAKEQNEYTNGIIVLRNSLIDKDINASYIFKIGNG